MSSLTDDIIINGIRNRDDNVFKYLQVKFQDSIRLMVMEMGGSPEDAQDVFNEGLIALIRLVDKEDFKLTSKLGTLIYALCNKQWRQQLEKQIAARNYHVRKLDTTPVRDFTEDSDFELYRTIFWENFEKLETVCKEILKGYFKEISPRVIAENLGFTYGYVRKRKSLCHSYLMRMIENHPDYIKIKETEQIEVVK
ncbi:MAG: sigma-70 family RNA polymerase sigma factor [Bacteroidales bacterium]|nr:sigma-70 family RNA polymerase sigma factor [Bacteroidales bacterium]